MKKIFFALIFSIFFLGEASANTDLDRYYNECKSFINHPKVELYSSYGRLKYKFDTEADFLKRETAKKFSEQHVEMKDDFAPVGLTKVQDIFNFDFTAGTMGASHGYTCIFPETIKVTLEYSLPTIYLFKGLQKDSCMYNLALRHEKTHMQIYIEALDYFLPLLKKHLEQMYDTLGFVVVAKGESLEEGAKKLNETYLADVQKKVDSWHDELNTEQMKMDTLEQYELETLICRYLEESKSN